jgi:L-lactate dehydrogenase complex protein LldG
VSARDRLLERIRHGLGRGPLDATHAASLVERLARPQPNRLPAASRGDRATLLRRFAAKLRGVDASLEVLPALDAVPAAVAAWATDDDTVRVTPHPELEALDWKEAGLTASFGPARGEDTLGVSRADAGIAESGTLVLCSGPTSPTSLNFLPDRHVVVLQADAVVGAYETVWAALRERAPEGRFMPRTVNWITGPSRTADIEQTLYLGIHGPRRLHVLLVDAGPEVLETG